VREKVTTLKYPSTHPLLEETPKQLMQRLAWCVLTPELVTIPQNFFVHANDRAQFWQSFKREVERNTQEKRIDKLYQDIEQLKTFRLGDLFECFINFIFSVHPDYQVIERNLQVIVDGVTLGELDLLVQNKNNRSLLHIEMASKFYLNIPWMGKDFWVGSNVKDRLDLKLDRLIHHQLALSSHPAMLHWLAERNLPKAQACSLLRGQLFHSLSSMSERMKLSDTGSTPDSQMRNSFKALSATAVWATSEELEQGLQSLGQSTEQLSVVRLEKFQWLGLCDFSHTPSNLSDLLEQGVAKRPSILRINADNEDEFSVFWLPSEWPDKVNNEYPDPLS